MLYIYIVLRLLIISLIISIQVKSQSFSQITPSVEDETDPSFPDFGGLQGLTLNLQYSVLSP